MITFICNHEGWHIDFGYGLRALNKANIHRFYQWLGSDPQMNVHVISYSNNLETTFEGIIICRGVDILLAQRDAIVRKSIKKAKVHISNPDEAYEWAYSNKYSKRLDQLLGAAIIAQAIEEYINICEHDHAISVKESAKKMMQIHEEAFKRLAN